MTVSGELCCVALPFCCVVVVALPFSASLEGLFMCTYTYIGMTVSLSCLYSNIVVCTHVYCSVDKCVHISVSAYHIYIYIYMCVCVCIYCKRYWDRHVTYMYAGVQYYYSSLLVECYALLASGRVRMQN